MPTPEFLTARDIAPRLGVSPRRVHALIRQGKLPHVKTGTRAVRVPARAFEQWLEAQNQAARASLRPASLPAPLRLADVLASYPASTPEAATGDAWERLSALVTDIEAKHTERVHNTLAGLGIARSK